MSGSMIPPAFAAATFVPIPRGEKIPHCKWGDLRLSVAGAQQHLDRGGNLAVRVGRDSGGLADGDLDCPEALALAPIYLPSTKAKSGRQSNPGSHWFYSAPGAIYAAFADPLDGTMLIELRADGRDGGAHLSLIPPSETDGERRSWHGDTVEPAVVDAAGLARRMAWLAIGCLVMRHLSEHAARRPGPDLPALLWEADPALGRAAYRWLGEPAPDEPRRHPKPRGDMSRAELDLAELVAAIPNSLDWASWNRIGMAIYAASGGSNEGGIVFDDFSAKSPKYDPYKTSQRWKNYGRSPPSRTGLGSLVYLARLHGWQGAA